MINVILHDEGDQPSKKPGDDIDALVDETKTEVGKMIRTVQKIEGCSEAETNGGIGSNMDGQVTYNNDFSTPGLEILYSVKSTGTNVSVLICFGKPGWVIVNDGISRVQLSLYPDRHTVTESSGGSNPAVSLDRFKHVRNGAISKITQAIEEISHQKPVE